MCMPDFVEYLTEHQTDVQDLKKNLKRKHKQSLELFKELYPMLTAKLNTCHDAV